MIAPRRVITFRDVEYGIVQRGEAWAISVAGAEYLVTAANDPVDAAARFIDARMRNVLDPQRPAFLASKRYPLLLTVDGVLVRAWPAFQPRGTGASTYESPATGDRVATVKGPMWMFAARGRSASESGTVTPEQTVDDVVDLAKVWLRSHE